MCSILMDVTRAVEGKVMFHVSGFGQQRWLVDTGTDLPVFLEQLTDALRAIALGLPANIDFYEQGLERHLTLTPLGDDCLVKCMSLTDWQPDPEDERIGTAELLQMLIVFRDQFIDLLRHVAPGLLTHPWVRAWCEPR